VNIAIKSEPYSAQLHAEIMPLAQKCWNESTVAKGETCAFYGERDFDVMPDTDSYQRLADQGILVIITLRDRGELKGYIEGFSYQGLHHHKIKGGIGDSMYLEPDYRAYIAPMAEKFEAEMQRLGVEIIGWPVTPEGPIHRVLKALKYVGDDIVMEKRLFQCV
jgi:hypothetical protein